VAAKNAVAAARSEEIEYAKPNCVCRPPFCLAFTVFSILFTHTLIYSTLAAHASKRRRIQTSAAATDTSSAAQQDATVQQDAKVQSILHFSPGVAQEEEVCQEGVRAAGNVKKIGQDEAGFENWRSNTFSVDPREQVCLSCVCVRISVLAVFAGSGRG